MLDSNNKLIRRSRPKWPDKFDRTNAPWKLREGVIRPVVKVCLNCRTRRVKDHHLYCSDCWRRIHGK